MDDKTSGACLTAPGSHASHEAHKGLRPSGFDPSRNISRFLQMVEDFGTLSGGQFRAKYSDHTPYEGYDYVLRHGRTLRRRLRDKDASLAEDATAAEPRSGGSLGPQDIAHPSSEQSS